MRLFESVNFLDFARFLAAFSDRASYEEKVKFIFWVYDVDGDGESNDRSSTSRGQAGCNDVLGVSGFWPVCSCRRFSKWACWLEAAGHPPVCVATGCSCTAITASTGLWFGDYAVNDRCHTHTVLSFAGRSSRDNCCAVRCCAVLQAL